MPAPESPVAMLRDDLQMLHARADGGCTVFDPLRNRFYHLDVVAAQMTAVWHDGRTAADIVAACDARYGLCVSAEAVAAFEQWLMANELTEPADEAAWRRLTATALQSRHGWFMSAVHNYLFIKIPLFAPEPMLDRLSPWLAVFYTRTYFVIIALIGVLGVYLASHEWDRLLATLPELFSLQAGALFAVSLAVVKSLHELGHAATAVRYGCRVPSMGLCFMVMVPMLYTDVSDAWRLQSRRQRLAIDAAGIVVEMCIACVATLVWVLLPEGPAKSIAAALATTSLIMSLGLNLNPFMRFDGYYILSDLLGVDNLQPRAFALGRWKLREWLFGLGASPPERFVPRMMTGLIAYAWAVWLYRLVVFTGIAVLVYTMAFKLLGLALFAVEIVFFIALPIWRELREWSKMRDVIVSRRRVLVTASIFVVLIAAMFVPWSTRIHAPAILEDREQAQLYPKRASAIAEMGASLGDAVQTGDLIVRLVSPDLDQDIASTRLRLQQAQRRLERRSADVQERAQTHVLEQAVVGLESRLAGLEVESRELRIVAPLAGRIAERDPHLHVGRWMQRSDAVALVRGHGAQVVRGYVSESDVARLDTRVPATFVPEQWDRPRLSVHIVHVSPVGSSGLEIAELAAHYGGGVASRLQQRAGEGRQHVPVSGQFLITAQVEDKSGEPSPRVLRGTLHAVGRPESFAARTWRHVLKVLMRESGM